MSGFWQETQGWSLPRLKRQLRLTWLGLLNEARNPGLRRPVLASALLFGVIALSLREVPMFASAALGEWAGRVYGSAGALWIAGRACRDLETSCPQGQLFGSKPADSGSSAALIWLSGLGFWLLLLGVGFFPAVVLLGVLGGRAGFAGQVVAFGQAAMVTVVFISFAYSAVRIFRTRTAGLVVAAAGLFGERPLREAGISPYSMQNLLIWGSLGVLAVATTALLLERIRREELHRPVAVGGLLGLLCLPVAGGSALSYRDLAPASTSEREYWERVQNQKLQMGRPVPGLGIADKRNPELNSTGRRGQVVFAFLYSPGDPASVQSLNALGRLQREMNAQGVQVLGVCFTPDRAQGWLHSHMSGVGFPVGVLNLGSKEASYRAAAVFKAFGVRKLPLLVVTDRRRTVREIRYDRYWELQTLRELAQSRIAEEPR